MSELYSTVETLRSEYREIFLKSFAEINKRVEDLRPQGFEGDLFDDFSKNPAGQKCCADVLTLLEKGISKEVFHIFWSTEALLIVLYSKNGKITNEGIQYFDNS